MFTDFSYDQDYTDFNNPAPAPSRGRGSRGRGVSVGGARGWGNGGGLSEKKVPVTGGHSLEKEDANKIQCDICNIFCVGPEPYKSHLAGARHQRNVQLNAQGAPPVKGKPGRSAGSSKKVRIAENLETYPKPLVGLEWVTEHTKEDPDIEAVYICEGCEAKCGPSSIMPHLVGFKHRAAFLKKNYLEQYKAAMGSNDTSTEEEPVEGAEPSKEKGRSRQEQSEIIAALCAQYEEEHGRKKMKMKKELQPFYNANTKVQEASTIARLEKKIAMLERQVRQGDIASTSSRGRGDRGRGDRGRVDRGRGDRGRGGADRGGGRGRGDRSGTRGRGRSDMSTDRGFGGAQSRGFSGGHGGATGRGRGRGTPSSSLIPSSSLMEWGSNDDSYESNYQPGPPSKRARGASARGRPLPYHDYDQDSYGLGYDYGYGEGYESYHQDYYGSSAFSRSPAPPRSQQNPPTASWSHTADPYRMAAPSNNSFGDLADLSSVETEEQAAQVLEISNKLTQALMSYRMKNTPAELRDKVGLGMLP